MNTHNLINTRRLECSYLIYCTAQISLLSLSSPIYWAHGKDRWHLLSNIRQFNKEQQTAAHQQQAICGTLMHVSHTGLCHIGTRRAMLYGQNDCLWDLWLTRKAARTGVVAQWSAAAEHCKAPFPEISYSLSLPLFTSCRNNSAAYTASLNWCNL